MDHTKRLSRTIALIFILGFAAFVRLRLLDFPLERDEGEYAYTGQLMLQGIPPYQLSYNMKLPGTYAAYAVIMALFGQTTRGIHLGLILVNSATILLVYFLGKRLFGPICGMVAAASFALFSLSYSVLGLAAHATHFVTLFGVAGALSIWHALEKERDQLLFWSGVLLGFAFLMKQQGLFFCAFGGAMLLWYELRRRPLQPRRLFARSALFASGAFLPLAIACAALAAAGVFARFWFWTFSYANQYASLTPLRRGWANFLAEFAVLWDAAPGIWILAGAGLVFILLRRKSVFPIVFTVALLGASLATACPGLYFRQHYFIPFLPALGILTGAAIQIGFDEIEHRQWKKTWLLLPLVLFLAAAADTIMRHRILFFSISPDEAARAIYRENPFPEAREIGRYIREHSAPDSRLAVLGSEPEIYFYSQRRSATGYIYAYPLMEPQKYALAMQQEMIAEIEATKPEYVVFVNVPPSWLGRPDSNPFIFDWIEKYGPAHWRTVGLIDVYPDRPALYRWDEKAVAINPRSSSFIRIFRRNDLF
jgi:MFS family permease